VGENWLQATQVAVIALVKSASSACTLLAAGFSPGQRRVVPYSIQTLRRLRPALFRQDLMALLDLLQHQKIKPLIAQRFPLAQARQAQELLGKGGVTGKIVLLPNEPSLQSPVA